MSSHSQPMLLRFASAALRATLRVWPEKSLPWGQALAAELHDIRQPSEALRWTLGGLVLFARSAVSHFMDWLKLPAGARLSANSPVTGKGPLRPRHPRLFTTGVLLATALVFLLPQSQEAFSTIAASWRAYGNSDSDLRALERLGQRAEKENDARTLAFVAMSLPHSDRATAFANRAVALDHDGLFRLAPAFPFYDRLWATYHLWQAATYALGALALFILFRRFLLAKRA